MSAQTIPPHPYGNPYQLGVALYGTVVKKGPVALPASGTATLFTVSGGAILVSALVGVVTTAVQNQACTLGIGTVPLVGAANTAGIGGPTSIQNLSLGSHITVPNAVGAPGQSLVTPALPGSSGTSVNNTYHGTVTVTVTGGTLTGCLVNGVAAGTGGSYQVPSHGTITLSWSVAPGSWAWASTSALVTDTFASEFTSKMFVVSAGAVTWTTSATNTGAVTWYLSYMHLDTQFGDIQPVQVVV